MSKQKRLEILLKKSTIQTTDFRLCEHASISYSAYSQETEEGLP